MFKPDDERVWKKMINASQALVELPKYNGVQLFNQQVTTHVLFSGVCNKVIWYYKNISMDRIHLSDVWKL